MTRIMIGVFFILHGLVHAGLAAAPIPKDATSRPGSFFTHPTRSWLLRRMHFTPGAIRTAGLSLVVLTTLGFVLAGMAALGVPFALMTNSSPGRCAAQPPGASGSR